MIMEKEGNTIEIIAHVCGNGLLKISVGNLYYF